MVNMREDCQFLKDVKRYFGLSGRTDKVLAQLEQLQTIIKDINLTNERS